MSLETQGNQTFGRDITDFAGMCRGRPKSLRKKVLGGRFGYFLFFSDRGRGKGSPSRWEGGGGWSFIENPRTGGVSRRGGGGAGGRLR